LASQDEGLLDRVRRLGGVPVVRIAQHSVVLLEQPSKSAQRIARKTDRRRWSGSEAVTDAERQLVNLVREHDKGRGGGVGGRRLDVAAAAASSAIHKRKQGKAKGPNPLSCRKKRQPGDGSREDGGAAGQTDRPAKRRRRNK
jgi:hypothetical protein